MSVKFLIQIGKIDWFVWDIHTDKGGTYNECKEVAWLFDIIIVDLNECVIGLVTLEGS